MATGLLALLDDISVIAKAAAASIDDALGQSAVAGAKAAGTVIDDAAVTPRFVAGLDPKRELPIVGKIALGSLRNKLVILLPLALALDAFASWAVEPLLMFGGLFLCYEGAEKVFEALFGHGGADTAPETASSADFEKQRVGGAIRTDFILSAEIMTIALASIEAGNMWTKALSLALVGVIMTVGVYGAVALIVKADDMGLALARNARTALMRAVGCGLVRLMPRLMSVLSVIGVAAMIWVGGSIFAQGLAHFRLGWPKGWAEAAAEFGARSPVAGEAAGWLASAAVYGLFGLAVGALVLPVVHFALAPLLRGVGGLFRRGGALKPASTPDRASESRSVLHRNGDGGNKADLSSFPESSMTAAALEKNATATGPWLDEANAALNAVDGFYRDAIEGVRALVSKDGKISSALLEREQHASHGLSWLATYVQAVREMIHYAERMQSEGKLGETEVLLTRIGLSEYVAQIFGGIPMSQGEMVRPGDFGLTPEQIAKRRTPAVEGVIASGNTAKNRARLADLIDHAEAHATVGEPGLDETLEAIRTEMRKFAEAEVIPNAHKWHLKNEYIPLDVIKGLADLGVFGLTIPEEFGGMGLSKTSMCVVTEELSRAYIGVGSLGTRPEIAAELILAGGTDEQKAHYLPKIASGEILPTAVFTEPNTGSDLASLRTRAVKEGDVYKVYGNKTWITHPVRADLMTLLVRTNPNEPGYKGLSMLLAEKPRGDDSNPFPAQGMTGGEIEVLGYRGMKEFEIGFDGFEVKAENLLGGEEGQGFKQLMQTFESARIQTAARAVGVAQSAMELGLRYAKERLQFGKALINFPRVSDKIVMMAVETHIARQLTYFSARAKDEGRRCDLEAGMAKLLGARVAWAAADNALQIHGGNGFALEYAISRVLCDARILNIFEGAAEVQAMVIARRLLEGGN